MSWFYMGSIMKSAGEMHHLINDVLLVDGFDVEDLQGISMTKEAERLDEWVDEDDNNDSLMSHLRGSDGWKEDSVCI